MYNFFKRLLDIIVSLLFANYFYLFLLVHNFSILTFRRRSFLFSRTLWIYNSRFQIWKFATMLKNSMNMGTGSITFKMIRELQNWMHF